MPIQFTEKPIPGVFLIAPNKFKDNRGFFMEIFNSKRYSEEGIDQIFVQDNHSHSRQWTLRGLHYQLNNPQAKLIYVISGKIFDVAVDIRRNSPTFGRWTGALLSDENRHQFYIPGGFAHGFCVLSETADVIYKCSDFYAPGDEYGVLWSDPAIDIIWPVETPILSEKDNRNPKLHDILEEHLPIY